MTEATPWGHSLLTDPLITVRGPARRNKRQLTLPEILAELPQDGAIADFPKVAPHQRHPFHAFLVQLAAIALHRAGETDPIQSPERWREMLLNITDGDEGAFALVVEDLSKPALLQPPVPEGNLKKWKPVESADGLDILVTAKNHDVKATRVTDADPEIWFLSLLSLQTMQGFLGAGNYGVARMNGGFASRPEVGFAPSVRPGPRFVRDVRVLLDARTRVADHFQYENDGGHALLWLPPWDGKKSLALAQCDPFFIEICRRVRLTEVAGSIRCQYTSTKCARLDSKERNGVLGDPWVPVEAGGEKALTVPAAGFTYDRTQKLLWGDEYERPATQVIRNDDPPELVFTARVLVRGQGKTEGFHERLLPVRGKVRRLIADSDQTAKLSQVSKAWVELAAKMRNKVLRPALLVLLQGAPDKLNIKDKRANADLDRFEAAVDQRFFKSLFEALDKAGSDFDPLEVPESTWGRELVQIGERILRNAIARHPGPDARHYRAIAAANRTFFGAAKNQGFPTARTKPDASPSADNTQKEEVTP